jgi:hypothetical protein
VPQTALSQFETRRVEKLVAAYADSKRPPAHIRPKLDFGFRVSGQNVELFEIRPRFDAPHRKMEHGIAKATYVKSKDLWKIYWLRADLKWHRYDPNPEVDRLEDVLAVLERDEYGCFYG